MRPVAGVRGVSAAILCRLPPAPGCVNVRTDSRPNSARTAAGVHLSKSGRGVRGGLSHALPPGRVVPGGCPPARYLYNTTVCTFRQGRNLAVLVHFRRFGAVVSLLALYFIVFRLFALVFAVFTNNGKKAVKSYNLLIKFIFVNIWMPGRRSRERVPQWCERRTR